MARYQKGQSGNPNGRPKLTQEQKDVMSLTKGSLVKLLKFLLSSTLGELQEKAKDTATPALEVMICSIAIQIIKKGDMDAMEKLLTRVLGKPKEEFDISMNPVSVRIILPSNKREKNS